jgi:hypothetical protein
MTPESTDRVRETSIGLVACWRDGVRRVNGAPVVVLGVWSLSLLLALPLGLVLRGMIRASLGSSLAADSAAEGVNYDWWNEFLQSTGGIASTFVPSIIGFAAPLKNLSDVMDNAPLAITVASAVAVWLVVWALIAGGLFDRYARARTLHTPAFFAACGVFFFRFLRLGAMAFAVYWLLFEYVHRWLFASVYTAWTKEFAVEREAFFVRFGLYVVFASLLALVNIVLDYAKIRAVVEDRRSMVGAIAAGARFVFRHAGATIGLYLLNTAAFVLVLLLYAAVAPGAGWSGGWMWAAFALTQAYILGRVWAKLVFISSQIALFQARLAHAGYAAFPERPAPEAPVVESLGPAPLPPPRP